MDEDRPEDTLPPDSGRARRAPPTIDLEASDVSGETQAAAGGTAGESAGSQSRRSWRGPSAATIAAVATSAATGAVTAALVLVAAWYLGWPTETAAPPANAAVIDTLTSRLAEIESRSAGPAAVAPLHGQRCCCRDW